MRPTKLDLILCQILASSSLMEIAVRTWLTIQPTVWATSNLYPPHGEQAAP